MSPRAKFRRFEIVLYNRRPAEAEILNDMLRVARRCGRRPFTYSVYAARGAFSPRSVAGRFGSWRAALKAANLPVHIDRDVPEAELFANLARMWRRLGRQPTTRDLVKRGGVSRYSLAPYEARFGNWHKALLAFGDFVAGKRIARPIAAAPKKAKRRRRLPSPRRIAARLRARVLIRDNCLCRMCGAGPAKDPDVTLHVDHIVPWSKGGETVLANLQTLCARCNIGKGDLGAPPPSLSLNGPNLAT